MIYECYCECGHVTEVFTSDYNFKETECEKCGKVAKKGLSYVFHKGADHWRLMDDVRDGKYD